MFSLAFNSLIFLQDVQAAAAAAAEERRTVEKSEATSNSMNANTSTSTGSNQLLSVTPSSESSYVKLGQVELNDHILFCCQIAEGMVSAISCTSIYGYLDSF